MAVRTLAVAGHGSRGQRQQEQEEEDHLIIERSWRDEPASEALYALPLPCFLALSVDPRSSSSSSSLVGGDSRANMRSTQVHLLPLVPFFARFRSRLPPSSLRLS